MDQDKKGLPQYKVRGLIGITVSMAIAFAGVYYKDISILGLFTPIGLLLGVFFIGYQMNGKVKDGIIWILSIIMLFSVIITLTLLLK